MAIDLIQWALICRLSMGGLDLLAAPNALIAKLAHQPLHSAASDVDLLPLHCVPELARCIDRSVLLPNVLDLRAKKRIAFGPIRSPVLSLMKAIFCETGGRAAPAQNMRSTIVLGAMAENALTLFKVLIGLMQLPVLTLTFLDPVTFGCRYTIALAGVPLMRLHPEAQAVCAASNFLRDRQNCRRSARIFVLVIQNHPHRSGAQFLWITCAIFRRSYDPASLLLGRRQNRGRSAFQT